jgi:hypothetical protein
MKTRNFTQPVLLLGALGLSSLQIFSPNPAQAQAPIAEFREGSVGNGGGGVIRNGIYLTFGSAQVRVRPQAIETLPALQKLDRVFSQMPLEAADSGVFLGAIYPAGDRQYFSIDEKDLDPMKHEELKRKYHEAIRFQTPLDSLVVYAITRGTETYLLPEFFKLNETQQAAILFHEALWIVNPKLTYAEVIDAEIVFQDYLERNPDRYPFESQLYSRFDEILGNPTLSLLAAAKDDFKNGRLKPFLNAAGELPLVNVLGRGTLVCRGAEYEIDSPQRLGAHLAYMMRTHPGVQLYRQLFALRDRLRLILLGYNFRALCDYGFGVARVEEAGQFNLWSFRSTFLANKRMFGLTAAPGTHTELSQLLDGRYGLTVLPKKPKSKKPKSREE